MTHLERLYGLHKILSSRRRTISAQALLERLECSRPTRSRLIAELRDDFGAPIDYQADGTGYCYAQGDGKPFERPALWFSPAELHALLVLQKLLQASQPRLFEHLLAPLRHRLEQLLDHPQWGGDQLRSRIRIIGQGSRQPDSTVFERAASALVERRRLEVDYHARGSAQRSRRVLSTQRMIHYRDNWHLDAWCHQRGALRTFALDRMAAPQLRAEPADELPDADLDAHFTGTYGIFGGPIRAVAVLRFTAERARWVAEEGWFPQQQGRLLPDGRYELRLPYSDPPELVMDILKYGPDVEVCAPEDLRAEVARRLRAALEQYEDKKI